MAKKGLDNFKSTLNSLKEFTAEPIVNDRDKAGIIQAFEFTFEQYWKALQQKATEHGVTVGSPKSAFTFAMQNFYIPSSDEKIWLEMLEDRNLTTHTYKKELVDQFLSRIQMQYIRAFDGLLDKLIQQ